MVKAKMAIVNPADIEVSLTMTMKLKEWKELKEQMNSDRWPSCDLTGKISEIVRQIDKVYYPEASQ